MVIINKIAPNLDSNVVIIPLLSNFHIPMVESTLLGYYIYDYSELYYLNIGHPDSLPADFTLNTLVAGKSVYSTNSVYLYYKENIKSTPVQSIIPFINWHNIDIYNKDYNKIIPLAKLTRYLSDSLSQIEQKPVDSWYIDNMLDVLLYLNKQVINTETNLYHNNYSYNTYGRPTNTFDGKNILSMNKYEKAGIITDQNLVEIDFVAYHMHIIADLIGYTFPEDDIYAVLAKEIHPNKPDARNIIKTTCLVEAYSSTHTINHPFFNKLNDYKQSFIEKVQLSHEFITNRVISYDKPDIDYRVFSIYLQTLETERNFVVMDKIMRLLQGTQSKLLLYIYDSFILDIDHMSELLYDVQMLLLRNGPIKSSVIT